MNFKTKYKLMLLKSYFDVGYGTSSYLKYLIAFFALASADVKTTLIFSFLYGLGCFILGWMMFKYGWINAQAEVNNQYNLFVREMRRKLKKRNI